MRASSRSCSPMRRPRCRPGAARTGFWARTRSRSAHRAASTDRSCSTCHRRSPRAARSVAPSRAAGGTRSASRSIAQRGPPTDPKAALGGVVLPIGGYKGSGLSMLMDILGGVISGAAFAGGVADQYKSYDRPQDVGHFFLTLKPDLFIPEADYRARMDTLVERVRACPKAEGFDEILIPGEPEA